MSRKSSDSGSYLEFIIYLPDSLADPVSSFITDNITSSLIFEETENLNMLGLKFCMLKSEDKILLTDLRRYLKQFAEINSIEIPEIHEKIIESVDSEEDYRNKVKAIEISPELLIRPPWVNSKSDYKYDIVIEPKMAFGTGIDESTANCLRLMQKYFVSGQRFLDFGCGSGILSVFADRLSASYVKAIDNNPDAIDCCRENFELNSVTVRHDILGGSIGEINQEEKFDMICANIAKEPILEFLRTLIDHTTENGYLVLSGIFVSEREEMERALKQNKLTTVDFIQGKMWLTYCMRK